MIRHHLFERMATFSVKRPRVVVTVTLLLSALSLVAVKTNLVLKTSNLDLIDQRLPEIKAFLDFAHEFGTPNVLVVVLEGNNSAAMEKAVEALGPSLRALPGVRSVVEKIPLDTQRLNNAGVYPYLASRDRGLFMMFVQPEDTRSQAETISPLIDAVRATLNGYDLKSAGITAGLTGIPQYAIDDRDVIKHDISYLSYVSFIFIGILFVVAFAALRRPLMAMVTLAFAVVVILGAITIYPGHLTLLSAFFASILFGLGIDYGIHIINRMEEYMYGGMSEREAIPKSISVLAPELTTGAITTAVAFFSMTATDFRGFAELGMIAGFGILVCLFMMATLLPALLTIVPHRQNRTISSRESRVGKLLFALQRPVIILPFAIISIALCVMGGPGFDGNYTNLQPAKSEAVRLERELVERSSLSTQFAVFTLDSKARAIDLADRLLDEETVSDVRSIADLELLAPVDGESSHWPEDFIRGFVSVSNRYAVYAYPAGDVWNPEIQAAFVAGMKKLDPRVTGMPFLGKFMTGQSIRALLIAGVIGGVLLFVCVWLNFRRLTPTILAVLPTYMTVAGMHGIMKLLDMPFNPINVMALPVILGIAVDDGVHVVHRFMQEKGDVARTLAGSGRSVVLTSLTTIAAFASLAFTRHRGLASFSVLLVIGVTFALLLSVLLLPRLLKLFEKRLLAAPSGN
jgi:predicted RND superfamily exporter protein